MDLGPWTLDFAIRPRLPHQASQEGEPLSQESEDRYHLTAGWGGLEDDTLLESVKSDTRSNPFWGLRFSFHKLLVLW